MKIAKMLTVTMFLVAASGLFAGQLHAEAMRVTANLRGEAVVLPASTPLKEELLLVSFFKVTFDGQFIALMAVYDDPHTAVQADYFELYDGMGNLLSVSWVDQFGVRRIAMDRGLLEEERTGVEGVLIFVVAGDVA